MMKKNSILFIITLVLLVGVMMLSGCEELIGSNNFEAINIGERFDGNRDGYLVKLNESFFASVLYNTNEEIEIYKMGDIPSEDYFGISELYYSDIISECYCDNSLIIVYSLTKNKYVIIDCNDINNIQSFSETDSENIDLTKFIKIDLRY